MTHFEDSRTKISETILRSQQILHDKENLPPRPFRVPSPTGSFSQESSFSVSNELKELRTLLEAESKRNAILEEKISHKDILLGEMAALQNTLYENIEELQRAQGNTQFNLKSNSQIECESYSFEIDNLKRILARKEEENLALVKQLNQLRKNEESADTAPSNRDEQILQEIRSVLKAETNSSVLEKVQHLHREHIKEKEYKKFVNKIGAMISELTAENSKKFNMAQIWRWLTKLLENYMKMKQSIEGKTLMELEHLLQVPQHRILEKVRSLIMK